MHAIAAAEARNRFRSFQKNTDASVGAIGWMDYFGHLERSQNGTQNEPT
jgi:hypothetical protein